MAFSFGDCASDASCASLHSENGQRVIPCRISEGDAPDPSATAILTDGYGDFAQLSRKLEMFAVFELFFALLAVFFFGAFPLEELFFGHLVIVAGGEHGTALSALRGAEAAAFSIGGGKIAHAAYGVSEHTCFDEKFADFFEEVVQMVWLEQVRKAFFFQDGLGIASRQQRHQEENTDAFGAGGVHFGAFERVGIALRQVFEDVE